MDGGRVKKRDVMRVAKAVVAWEDGARDPDAGVNECVACSEHYHIGDGLDASALCNTCAQTLVVEFARLIGKLTVAA